MKHLNVLATVFILLVGVWAVFYFRQRSRRFPGFRLHYLLRYTILFNLLQLSLFIQVYFRSNLTQPQWLSVFSWIKGAAWPVNTALILGMYISQYKMIAGLRERKLPKWVVPFLFLFTAALMLWFFLAMHDPAYMPKGPHLTFWNLYVWPLNLLELAWLARLLPGKSQGSDPGRRRASRAFALLFLLRMALQLTLLFLGMLPLPLWNIALSKLLILYTSLVPIFWLTRFFIPWAGALSKISNAGSRLDSLQQSHGVSARELEILKLILDGKSNKQIEDVLFISIHTVKSHVYNLYRKIGVKNYRQLTHFVASRQQENC